MMMVLKKYHFSKKVPLRICSGKDFFVFYMKEIVFIKYKFYCHKLIRYYKYFVIC